MHNLFKESSLNRWSKILSMWQFPCHFKLINISVIRLFFPLIEATFNKMNTE